MSGLRLTALAAAACLVAAVAPASASSLLFTGIRPGTLLLFHATPIYRGNACTANFVFQTTGNAFDPSQQLYIGSAGHCGSLGGSVEAVYVPPGGGGTTSRIHIGTVVVDGNPSDTPDDDANDFLLIAIDPVLNSLVSPSMAWWGGPTGVHPGGTGVVTWTGQAEFVGGTVPRVGQLGAYDPVIQVYNTVVGEGDSGSPVNTIGGLAVGSVASINSGPVDTVAHGPSIGRMLALAGHPLATCTSAKPWPLPGCPAA